MSLDKITARECIEEWSAGLASPWTEQQRAELADQLVNLTNFVEPHLVQDVPLEPERAQAYFLARTVSHLEDWLVLAAARQFPVSTSGSLLGLRSATQQEIESLPGIGSELAADIRHRLTMRPPVRDLETLREVRGIGAERVEQLQATSYLEEPVAALVSPTMWTFASVPNIPHALALFETSDVSFVFGDSNAIERRLPAVDTGSYERFSAFIAFVADRAQVSVSGAAGSLASEAIRWLNRHERRQQLLASTQKTTGALLVNDAYVEATKAAIEAATTSVSLMVFLGTASDGEAGQAPLPLVEALEAAANRPGIKVNVILDQDDDGKPYKSALINRALAKRLQASAVQVKYDTKETLLHSKVLVVDRKVCVVGSHNWTRTSLTRTHELSVLLESAVVAGEFQDRFDALWGVLPDLQ